MSSYSIVSVAPKCSSSSFANCKPDYQLEIDEKVPIKFAAIALHLDSRTVKAAGKKEEYYEGYRDAAVGVLNLLQIEIVQDDQLKVISLLYKESDDDKQEELKQHIWG